MFSLIFNFQVNYEKLLRFLKVAASEDTKQNKGVEDSNVKETQSSSHQRYFSPYLWAWCVQTSRAGRDLGSNTLQDFTPCRITSLFTNFAFCLQVSFSLLCRHACKVICNNASFVMRLPCENEKPHYEIMSVYQAEFMSTWCDSRNMFRQ